jgi:hypothetical protein
MGRRWPKRARAIVKGSNIRVKPERHLGSARKMVWQVKRGKGAERAQIYIGQLLWQGMRKSLGAPCE